MSTPNALRPAMPILIGAAVMLTLSMGIRQCFGLFVQPITKDLALTVSDFAFALSLQNLAWGFFQPFTGALVVRHGFRPILVGGAVLYPAGLVALASAQGMFGVLLGGGLLIGMSLACTASAMAQATASRAVPASVRSLVLGIITGASGGMVFPRPFYAALGTTFILSFASQGAGRPLWPFLAGTVRLLIAAGVGMIAVDDWGADMFGLSIIVACASIASATVCLSAARLGLIWPAPVAAP